MNDRFEPVVTKLSSDMANRAIMTMFDSYMICTSPRSGSTLLCSLLAATGVAGKPASYFYDPSVEEWCADLGVEVDPCATERKVLEAVLRVVVSKGRNGTGLFGLRQQAGGLAFLCEKLSVLFPQEATDAGRVRQAFGATQFIHLTRSDKIEQAVSFVKAKQTGLWHVAPDGSELERNAPHSEPSYDIDKIRACVELMTAYDRDWNDWFLREGIEPVRIDYDDLAANPVNILRYVLTRLGLDAAAACGIAPGVKKLADKTNENWVSRFRADQRVT